MSTLVEDEAWDLSCSWCRGAYNMDVSTSTADELAERDRLTSTAVSAFRIARMLMERQRLPFVSGNVDGAGGVGEVVVGEMDAGEMDVGEVDVGEVDVGGVDVGGVDGELVVDETIMTAAEIALQDQQDVSQMQRISVNTRVTSRCWLLRVTVFYLGARTLQGEQGVGHRVVPRKGDLASDEGTRGPFAQATTCPCRRDTGGI